MSELCSNAIHNLALAVFKLFLPFPPSMGVCGLGEAATPQPDTAGSQRSGKPLTTPEL